MREVNLLKTSSSLRYSGRTKLTCAVKNTSYLCWISDSFIKFDHDATNSSLSQTRYSLH